MKLTPKKIAVLAAMAVSSLFMVSLVPLPTSFDAVAIALYVTSVTGFIGVVLLLWQLILGTRSLIGSYDKDLSWSMAWHKNIGIYGTLFIFLHPLVSLYAYAESFFYIFLPNFTTEYETAVTWGRVSFVFLIIIWVTSAVIRGKIRYRPWKYIHYLGYAALPFVALHAPDIGTTFAAIPNMSVIWNGIITLFVILLLLRARYFLGFGKQQYVLVDNQSVGDATHVLTLRPLQKSLKPRPGQFIYLQLGLGGEEHPFSVLSFDKDTGYLQVAFKEFGTFTKKAASVAAGKRLYVDGPYGTFTHQMESSKQAILIAGGIGLTPFLSQVESAKVAYTFYCTRQQDAPFADQLRKSLHGRFVHVVSDEQAVSESVEKGYYNKTLASKYVAHPVDYQYFVCGPPPFMTAVKKELHAQGVQPNAIFTEEFSF